MELLVENIMLPLWAEMQQISRSKTLLAISDVACLHSTFCETFGL